MTSPTPVELLFFPVSGDYQSPDDPAPQSTTSAPDVEAVMGLVLFTPRLPKGFTAFVDNYQINQDSSCVQTVNLFGAITGGTWALEFGGIWTSALSPAATPAQLQTALAALASVGAGNVSVVATTPNPGYTSYTVTFGGTLGNSPQPQMTGDPTNLTVSSGAPAVTVVMLNGGSTSRVGPTAVPIAPRHGRIWTSGQLCSINASDSPGVELLANMPELGLTFPLIYDVTFSAVQYNGVNQALAPFAFTAPADATPFSLTDPTSTLLQYQPPIQQSWYPGWTPANPGNVTPITAAYNWREAG